MSVRRAVAILLAGGLPLAIGQSAFAAFANFNIIAGRAQAGITRTLSYNSALHRWVFRIDPMNIASFQIDIGFDPLRAQFVALDYISPFVQTTPPDLTQLAAGLLNDVAGSTVSPVAGDVDIFEVTFQDLQPAAPIDGVTFSAFASSNDFFNAIDTDNANAPVHIEPADIVGTTASVPEPILAGLPMCLMLFRRRNPPRRD